MERIQIPQDAEAIVSTSSKGDQSKWLVGNKWLKENTRGYENMAEYAASLILDSSTLPKASFVPYTPCLIEKSDGTVVEGCYSIDFRGHLQEVTLERLFEANFETTDEILSNNRYSTSNKFNAIMEKIHEFTGLDVSNQIAEMLAFDAFILNEDRHTNNILFLFDPKTEAWKLAPIFDHGLSLLSDVKDYPLGVDLQISKRKVKAKPFNNSFKKQLSLYDGPPFINVTKLQKRLLSSPYPLGRALDVINLQVNDPAYEKLLFRGENE
jgi:hypothetical protein